MVTNELRRPWLTCTDCRLSRDRIRSEIRFTGTVDGFLLSVVSASLFSSSFAAKDSACLGRFSDSSVRTVCSKRCFHAPLFSSSLPAKDSSCFGPFRGSSPFTEWSSCKVSPAFRRRKYKGKQLYEEVEVVNILCFVFFPTGLTYKKKKKYQNCSRIVVRFARHFCHYF